MIENQRQHQTIFLMSILLTIAFLISACGSSESPENAIEDYIHALAEKDQTAAVSNSCSDWEENAMAEGASFINVEVTLADLSCQVERQSDTQAAVSCSGKFLFSYDAGEDQELDLSGRVFSAVQEGGEWRMCGYQE